MIRRHLVSALAVLALGLVVAAPAEAGGASPGAVGVKKNAYLRITNKTATPYYVVAVPSTLQVPTTPYQAKRLGGILLNGNQSLLYPVPAGNGGLFATSQAAIPADPNAPIAFFTGAAAYTVAKGKTQAASVIAGGVVTVP